MTKTTREEKIVCPGVYEVPVEQEPVAWRYRGNLHEFDPSDWAEGPVTPLYTAPQRREWVGLTEEEKVNVAIACGCVDVAWMDFADVIEAKLREKNA